MRKNAIQTIREFYAVVGELTSRAEVRRLRDTIHHRCYSRYYHSLHVAYLTFRITKRLRLDYVSATRAAMLHDFFYFEWKRAKLSRSDGYVWKHPIIAYKRARRLFPINEKEKDIIVKHMWPFANGVPKYAESWIVCAVDTLQAIIEYTRADEARKTFARNNYNAMPRYRLMPAR